MSAETPDAAVLRCADRKLAEATAYVLSNPGKQLRSRLTRESCELIAGETLPAAICIGTAIEWLHAYSLVHDDLPAMDDDPMRRGKPTVHVAYDEATKDATGACRDLAQYQGISSSYSIKCVKSDEKSGKRHACSNGEIDVWVARY